MTKTPRTYVIDTPDVPQRAYPIHFTEDTPLFASFGTVISIDGVEHMRTQDGWIDAFGGKLTHEEMKDYLIEHRHDSYIIHNPYHPRV